MSKVNILSRLYAPFVAGKKVKIKVGKHGESIVLHYVPLLHRQTKVFIPPSISMKDVKVIISNVEQKRVRFQGRYVFITVNKVKSNRTVQAVITIG